MVAGEDVAGSGPGPAPVDGPRHGPWRIVRRDGSVEEGCCVNGLLHGEWTLRDPEGRVVARERWRLGRPAGPAERDGGPCGVAVPDECGRDSAP